MQPEWYFLFAYAILHFFPNKLEEVIALTISKKLRTETLKAWVPLALVRFTRGTTRLNEEKNIYINNNKTLGKHWTLFYWVSRCVID